MDTGQHEAASLSLGMSPAYTLFRVVLPQAMRAGDPRPMGNETISMLKNTSLLSVIAVLELYTVATQISSQNLRQVELLVVVSCWYLFLTSVLSVPQYYLERHYGRGNARQQSPHPPRQDPGRTAQNPDPRRIERTPAMTVALAFPRHQEHPAPAPPLLVATNVRKHYGGVEVLKGISLSVNAGEVVCLLGPCGSGKTTLLRCINHLETHRRRRASGSTASWSATARPTAGSRADASARSPASARDIGMVFQRFNLFPHMTALENVIEAPDRGCKKCRAGRREARAWTCSTGSASPTRPTPTRAALRRAAAARRHRPRARDGAEAHAVRRADLRARPRAGRRGARRHAGLAATA